MPIHPDFMRDKDTKMTTDNGEITLISQKQKINTRCFTAENLAPGDDVIG
jgi:hypothetical protein